MTRPFRVFAASAMLAWAIPAAAQAVQFDPTALADAEGDGLVSQDEFVAFYSIYWSLFNAGKPEVEVAKANPVIRATILGVMPDAPATVHRDDVLDAAAVRYRDADRDGDGSVTLAEMKAWRAAAMSPGSEAPPKAPGTAESGGGGR